jgi:hypothetical protein
LRSCHIGENETYTHTGCPGLTDFVARCPRLEQLTVCAHGTDTDALFALNMPNLRGLGVHCCHHYPIDILAENPSLTRLATLAFVPHAPEPGDDEAYLQTTDLEQIGRSKYLTGLADLSFNLWSGGDRAADVLVQTGLLFRLVALDLSYGDMTDDGARLLADRLGRQPHRLKRLNVSGNALTPSGISALTQVGLDVTAADQHRSGEDYLYFGDME